MAWLTGWSHRAKVTIDATLVDEGVPVIPVFLSEGDTAFWTAIAAGGADLRFTQDDGETLLDHYLVPTLVDSGTTGTACVLVNVSGIISASSDVDFYAYVGNAGASSTSSGADVFSGTDIEAFYLPGVTTDDITGNGYDLTAVNSPTTAASDYEGVTAAVYNGSTQYHYHAGAITIKGLEGLFSFGSTAINQWFFSGGDSTDPDPLFGLYFQSAAYPSIGVRGISTGFVAYANTPSSVTTSTYYHVAGAYPLSGTTYSAYLDGIENTRSDTAYTPSTIDRVAIGALLRSTAGNHTSVSVAMAAVYSASPTADYVSTNRNAWHDADFLTFGATVGATDTGWQLFAAASTVTPGNTTWTNASNALTDDSNYASADIPDGDTSYTLKLTGADLSAIPSDATIAGWEYRIAKTGEDGGSEEIVDQTVQPIIAGTQSGTNVASASAWSDASIETTDYGSDSQKYGLTPTVANMKDSGTGLAIQAYSQGGSTAEARIYTAWIRVHWTPAGSGPTAADKARGFFAAL